MLFTLSDMIAWQRQLACSLDEGPGRKEAAMLAGLMRVRGLQSAYRKARVGGT